MIDNFDKILRILKDRIYKYRYVIIFIISISCIFFYFNNIHNDTDIANLKEYYANDINETNSINTTANNSSKKIVVHIDGQVNTPGVYYISNTAILNDLISLAGGFTSEANTKNINLASKLSDGEKIYIYTNEEIENNSNSSSTIFETTPLNGKININNASKEQLMTLPGIGEATAQKIINYRQQSGNFKNIHDITNVNGIGESKFNNISSSICI